MRTYLDVGLMVSITFLILSCAGCAAMYGIPTMPATELAKATQSADVSCITFPTPWGVGKAVVANTEKGIIKNGSITADANCNLTITNTIPAK